MDELIETVKEFRTGIIGTGSINLKCYPICSPLSSYLNSIGHKNKLITGWVIDNRKCWIHYWIRLRSRKIVDPTAGQFRKSCEIKDGIYIGKMPGWYYVDENKLRKDFFPNLFK